MGPSSAAGASLDERLCRVNLRVREVERENKFPMQSLNPARPTLTVKEGNSSIIVQREVGPLVTLTREVEPRTFHSCPYVPPPRPSDDGPRMAGAALWEMLGTDEVRAAVMVLDADDMGALACAHRAFALPVEEAARVLLKRFEDAPCPLRCRISNAFCEPAWRAYKAAARYHGAAPTLAGGGAHTLIIRDGRVHACGRDSCGQLGLEAGAYDVATPQPLPATAFAGAAVAFVAAGAHHSLAVGRDGSLWAWGKAADHQLGVGAAATTIVRPTRVALRDGSGGPLLATACAAGSAHSLAVDVDGGLWSWGRNAHGQLGHGTARPSPLPRRVLPLRARPVVAAAAGAFHSLAVLKEGALYAFGLGADGRLGLGHALNASLPEKVPLRAFVRGAAAGATHSACCDDAGALYTWGDGSKGALGHRGPRPRADKRDTGLASMPSWESARALGEALQYASGPAPGSEHAPRAVAALRHVRVVAVQCGERETVALDGDGQVYVVGQGLVGEAPADKAAAAPSPKASPKNQPFAGIGRARAAPARRPSGGGGSKSGCVVHRFHAPAAEVASTTRHVVARTVEDTYFAWGETGGAALGVGDARGRLKPAALHPWP